MKNFFDEYIKKPLEESDSTTTSSESTLTDGDLRASIEEMKRFTPRHFIQEILVTELVPGDNLQILHDKYMCMNRLTYEYLKKEIG